MDVVAEHHLSVERLTRNSLMRSAYITGKSCGYIAYHWDRKFISHPGEDARNAIRLLRSWRKDNPDLLDRKIGLEPTEYKLLVEIGFDRQYSRESRGRRKYPFNKAWQTSVYNVDP
jgi:hypothetical protein